ncbi:MAG: 2-oxoacid:acceptor oxidoreductase subunit alpha [Candidatus Magasanikbacteria bacterium]|nr:2-oxoacid:acceptor oxidoreductase subunit alpha [Candidatus Magasanikbacteria bacterium]
MQPFSVKIGGEAGFGIMSSGLIFSKVATRSGYHVFNYMEYPSIIRGGHNVMQIMVSEKSIAASYKHTDFLIALNQQTIDLHVSELSLNAGLMYDSATCVLPKLPKGVTVFDIPIDKIVREIGGSFIFRNTIAIGAAAALVGGDIKILKDLLAEGFAGKSKELIEKNFRVAEAGYNYARQQYANKTKPILAIKKKKQKQMVIAGNDAIALGSIAAGMQFAAIYPMTPISNILHTLAPLQEKYNFIYKQPEDEISAINMAIGASFAGARAMTASAGGGFCLMSEGYGLAAMTETPLVIIEGMRGGPATGLPTWTEQGDLRFVLHAHQGEFPRIVLAAGDANEAFHLTMQAFNLADKYQTPVIIIVDKQVCESHFSVSPFEYNKYIADRGKFTVKKQASYKRYALSKDGISLRSIPGVGNHIVVNSDEHNELGYSNEEAKNRLDQMSKRMQKLATCAKEDLAKPELIGPKDADVTIVSWGSNKGAILEAMNDFDNVNFLHLTWISPFPTEAVKNILHKANRILNIECNSTAQMAGLIKEKTGIGIKDNLLKYDGRPFFPEEIIAKIKKML